MIPLTIKYSPKSTSEILGQERATYTFKNFIANYKKQKKRALILYGPPGSGKTCSVYALAKELGLEILEVNASDFRDERRLNASIGQASKQKSLFATSKILLVDEMEGIVSRLDYGAIPTLIKLIKSTAFPIILTANSPWDKKFSALRTACELVEFKQLDHQTVLSLLRSICEKEGIQYEEKAIASLARRSGGDARGAIIDLQTLAENNSFTSKNLDLLSDRHKTDSIFNALLRVFKTTDAFIARTAFEDLEENLDEVLLWIDENLPKEYTNPSDLARAYEKISRADVFRGRIMRRQHWHFLAIISILLSAGIALSKDKKYETFTRLAPTQRILKIWRANQRFLQRKSIAEKIAHKTHCSTKAALKETLPYLKPIFEKNNKEAQYLADYLDLNQEEIEWLSANKV